jgi:LCP family protein required for cell wall assembly
LTGGRRRHPGRIDWRRILVFIAGFLVASLVMATVTAAALVWYGERQLGKVDVGGTQVPGDMDGDGDVDIPELRDLRNVLVVGSDSRDGLSRKERKELGTGQFTGTRTDTIMIVQLDPKRHGAAMLSFPRDLLVELCDGSQGRINGAYEIGRLSGVGGPTCLVRTVSKFTGIPIHHYVQIDFQGFVNVVDTLGGVKMYLDEPIQDEDAHVDLPAGCVTLNGAEALGFVRVRKIDSDFGRIARQQRFIREIIDKMSSAEVALNIPKLFRLVNAGAKAVETDRSLKLSVMRQIAFSFRDISSDNIDSRTVPAFNRTISGVAYVVADPEPAEALFDAFRRGVAAPKDVGRKGPADVSIADVPPVTVLNGTKTAGLAAAAAQALEARGFEVASTGDAKDQKQRVTQIFYPSDRREEADLLLKVFPGANVVLAEGAKGLRVEVGADADKEKLLALRPPSNGPPSPAATPTYKGAAPSGKHDC